MICKMSPKYYSVVNRVSIEEVLDEISSKILKIDDDGYIEVEEILMNVFEPPIIEISSLEPEEKPKKKYNKINRNPFFDQYNNLPEPIIDTFENSEKRVGYGKAIGRIKA